jgi:hypothetical protein
MTSDGDQRLPSKADDNSNYGRSRLLKVDDITLLKLRILLSEALQGLYGKVTLDETQKSELVSLVNRVFPDISMRDLDTFNRLVQNIENLSENIMEENILITFLFSFLDSVRSIGGTSASDWKEIEELINSLPFDCGGEITKLSREEITQPDDVFSPKDYLDRAYEVLELSYNAPTLLKKQQDLLEAISNIKRCLDARADELVELFALSGMATPSKEENRKSWDFKKKIGLIGQFVEIPPDKLQSLIILRNRLEHGHEKPRPGGYIKGYCAEAKTFLLLTEGIFKELPITNLVWEGYDMEVEVEWDRKNGLIFWRIYQRKKPESKDLYYPCHRSDLYAYLDSINLLYVLLKKLYQLPYFG